MVTVGRRRTAPTMIFAIFPDIFPDTDTDSYAGAGARDSMDSSLGGVRGALNRVNEPDSEVARLLLRFQ